MTDYQLLIDFKKPYKQGKTGNICTFARKSYNKAGVYIIKKDDNIVYTGMSTTSAYNRLYRHFQKFNDPYFERTVYPKYGLTVAVVLTDKPLELEKQLIKALKPLNNKYTFDTFENMNLPDWMKPVDLIPF